MRKNFLFSILAAALAVGGCKKTQDDTHQAAQEVKKSVEGEAKGDYQAAKDDLATARDKYAATVNDRLQKLDIKINELAARADEKSKDALAALRAERDSLASMIDSAKTRAAAGWDDFTKDVDHRFDQIEKSVNDALK